MDTAPQVADVFAQLRRDEDEVLHAYQDSEGYWTIGVGILIDKRKGGGITAEESAMLLSNRVRKVEAALLEALPWYQTLSAPRQAVLIGMAFNLGMDGLIGFHNALTAMQQGDWNSAANEMRSSRWATQVGARAGRLAQQMQTGEWV